MALAGELEWVVSTAQLHELGWTRRRIARAVEAGLLHRRHHGVYAVGRPQLSFAGCCRAAWLACGPGSAVSHISAAAHWNLRTSSGRIHVSVPRGRAGHPGLHVHRPRVLTTQDIVERGGYAVTSVARTLLDMSPGETVERVAGWMHEAGVQEVLDMRAIWDVLERLPHHRGRPVLEAALGQEVLPTRTGLERLMVGLARRAGLPKPKVNEHVWSTTGLEEVDLHWPELGLVVEADGGRYHGSRWRQRRDAAKAERLRAYGWIVARYPELQMTLAPAVVIADLRRLAGLGRSNAPQVCFS